MHSPDLLGGSPGWKVWVLASLLLLSTSAGAEQNSLGFDPETASFNELFFHVQRYGTTREKKNRRTAARSVLFARGAETIGYLVAHTHIENPWYFMLTDELVRKTEAASAVPVLLEQLKSDEPRVRKTAIFFLGFYNTPEHAEKVIPFLTDDKLGGVSARTLGKWGIESAVPRIMEDLNHENERRRILAVNALRDIGDARAIPGLIASLGDPLFTVRRTASRALLSFGVDAQHSLIETIPGAEPTILREIIRVLDSIASENALESLRPLLDNENDAVRREAQQAVERIEARVNE